MNKKRNPLNLNPLQLKTLALLQEFAQLPEHASDGGDGRIMVSNLPSPHGDHFHVAHRVAHGRDATGLSNPAVFVALERKGLIQSMYPLGAVLTTDGLAYETGMRDAILHGHHHH